MLKLIEWTLAKKGKIGAGVGGSAGILMFVLFLNDQSEARSKVYTDFKVKAVEQGVVYNKEQLKRIDDNIIIIRDSIIDLYKSKGK